MPATEDPFISTDFGPATPKLPVSKSSSLQRNSFPFCGRLIVLDSGRTKSFDPFAGLSSLVAINFPSMPDSVELARAVEYLVVPNMVMPDGIHQYKWTNPLSIPFSFKLHYLDKEFCPKGALSILQIAGLLNSFALPISSSPQTSLQVTIAQKNPGQTANGETDSLTNRAQSSDTPYNVTPESGADFSPPVTLRLELIFVDESSPGIVCTGYVKDVRVRLLGPWNRGPGRSANLPSAAEYEFTFVHVPGYGNNFSVTSNPAGVDSNMTQAFADDVKNKLYNTRDLAPAFNSNYKGLSS